MWTGPLVLPLLPKKSHVSNSSSTHPSLGAWIHPGVDRFQLGISLLLLLPLSTAQTISFNTYFGNNCTKPFQSATIYVTDPPLCVALTYYGTERWGAIMSSVVGCPVGKKLAVQMYDTYSNPVGSSCGTPRGASVEIASEGTCTLFDKSDNSPFTLSALCIDSKTVS